MITAGLFSRSPNEEVGRASAHPAGSPPAPHHVREVLRVGRGAGHITRFPARSLRPRSAVVNSAATRISYPFPGHLLPGPCRRDQIPQLRQIHASHVGQRDRDGQFVRDDADALSGVTVALSRRSLPRRARPACADPRRPEVARSRATCARTGTRRDTGLDVSREHSLPPPQVDLPQPGVGDGPLGQARPR